MFPIYIIKNTFSMNGMTKQFGWLRPMILKPGKMFRTNPFWRKGLEHMMQALLRQIRLLRIMETIICITTHLPTRIGCSQASTPCGHTMWWCRRMWSIGWNIQAMRLSMEIIRVLFWYLMEPYIDFIPCTIKYGGTILKNKCRKR